MEVPDQQDTWQLPAAASGEAEAPIPPNTEAVFDSNVVDAPPSMEPSTDSPEHFVDAPEASTDAPQTAMEASDLFMGDPDPIVDTPEPFMEAPQPFDPDLFMGSPEPVLEAPAPPTSFFGEPSGTGLNPEPNKKKGWKDNTQEKIDEEELAKRAMKDEAEKYLDGFHDQQTDKKVVKMETNRKVQDEVAAEKEGALQEARVDDMSRWRRVYEMTDVALATDAPAARMHKLLLNLKINGTMKA
mmetsp:Transcript_15279/g.30638  ORF Transcript_15279/g.30638 Transcript_15279/m.30638 type:complete len:242 (+) Transcript_15279:93-818(+)